MHLHPADFFLASVTDVPPVPLLACAGILVALLPAFVAPPLPVAASPATGSRSAGPTGGGRMIELEQVGVTFADADAPVLSGVDLSIPEGELVLVVGRTGSGKTTLLRALNGLVPHFSGGTLHGRVVVDGRDTRTHRPRDLADVVGYVGQDPLAGFVTDTVEDELAYGMESLGLPADLMRKRVEETLDLLGLADVRSRPVADLSGGQQQRVAIGSVLTTHPRVLVLDEPTSALDPLAAEEVLATLQRLVHDLGLTVVLAEHRLERVVQYADRVVLLPGGGLPVVHGTPVEVLRDSPVAPPVVELGRIAGWDPLPLSVRDARRLAAPLRSRLTRLDAPDRRTTDGAAVATAQHLVVSYGRVPALQGVSTRLAGGEVVALMGRNGAGQVDPAQDAGRDAPADQRHRRGGRAGPGGPAAGRAAAARRDGAAGAGRPALRLLGRPGVRAGRPGREGAGGHHARAVPAAVPRGAPRRGTPATCPRGSGSPWRWRSCSPRGRRCCCSTSRPGAWTTPRSTGWSRSCATWPTTGTRCCWPPTTWSWSPRSPPGCW